MTRRLARCRMPKWQNDRTGLVWVLLSSALDASHAVIAGGEPAAQTDGSAHQHRVAVCSDCYVRTAKRREPIKGSGRGSEERAANQPDGQDRGHADNRRVLALLLLDL